MISYSTRPSSAARISSASGAMLAASAFTGMKTQRSIERFSTIDPRDSEHICCTRSSEGDPGCDDHPFTRLGHLFAMRNADRLLHHIAKALNVAGMHAMCAPEDSEPPRCREVRREHQDWRLGALAGCPKSRRS